MPQPFLSQFREERWSTSLREHIAGTEVEVCHVGEATLCNYLVEAELVSTESSLGKLSQQEDHQAANVGHSLQMRQAVVSESLRGMGGIIRIARHRKQARLSNRRQSR